MTSTIFDRVGGGGYRFYATIPVVPFAKCRIEGEMEEKESLFNGLCFGEGGPQPSAQPWIPVMVKC